MIWVAMALEFHGSEMTPLPILLAAVYLGTGNFFFQNRSQELYPPIAALMFAKCEESLSRAF